MTPQNQNQGSAFNLLSQYDPNLPLLKQQSDAATNTAGQYSSAADLLPAQLKQAIQEKLNYNQDLISQQNQAQAQYFAAPSAARNQYQNIANPFEREQLVSQATANAYAPYATLTDILSQRQGNIADLVNQGTGAFNAAATAESNKANTANTAYSNALQLAQWLYGVQHPGGVAGAQSAQSTNNLINDIKQGKTLQDIVQEYSGELPLSQIISTYDQNSRYGAHKESSSQILKWAQGTGTPTAITPVTSTSGGNTSVTGWKIKTSDGVTHTVLPGGKQGPLSFFDIGTSPTDNIDPTAVYQTLQAEGYSDQQILDYLKAKGFTVQ